MEQETLTERGSRYVPLLVKYQMDDGEFPSAHATRYMHEAALGRDGCHL